MPNQLNKGMYLPKITAEMVDDFADTELIDMESFGPDWTQIAVDFACMLNNTCCVEHDAQLLEKYANEIADSCETYPEGHGSTVVHIADLMRDEASRLRRQAKVNNNA